jgi:hypothetical protein|tara:strand:+ start:1189 stop:1407 length:219 start_codon:yes stop_codon:yes gene_type:complete
MERMIKTFIHNEENNVYVLNISDKVSPTTIRTIMNMLLQEEEKMHTQRDNQNTQAPPLNQPPPTGGLESVVE